MYCRYSIVLLFLDFPNEYLCCETFNIQTNQGPPILVAGSVMLDILIELCSLQKPMSWRLSPYPLPFCPWLFPIPSTWLILSFLCYLLVLLVIRDSRRTTWIKSRMYSLWSQSLWRPELGDRSQLYSSTLRGSMSLPHLHMCLELAFGFQGKESYRLQLCGFWVCGISFLWIK